MTVTADRIAAAAATMEDLPALTDEQFRDVAVLLEASTPRSVRDDLALRLRTQAAGFGTFGALQPKTVRALADSIEQMPTAHPLLTALAALPDMQAALWHRPTLWARAEALRSPSCVKTVRDELLEEVLTEALAS